MSSYQASVLMITDEEYFTTTDVSSFAGLIAGVSGTDFTNRNSGFESQQTFSFVMTIIVYNAVVGDQIYFDYDNYSDTINDGTIAVTIDSYGYSNTKNRAAITFTNATFDHVLETVGGLVFYSYGYGSQTREVVVSVPIDSTIYIDRVGFSSNSVSYNLTRSQANSRNVVVISPLDMLLLSHGDSLENVLFEVDGSSVFQNVSGSITITSVNSSDENPEADSFTYNNSLGSAVEVDLSFDSDSSRTVFVMTITDAAYASYVSFLNSIAIVLSSESTREITVEFEMSDTVHFNSDLERVTTPIEMSIVFPEPSVTGSIQSPPEDESSPVSTPKKKKKKKVDGTSTDVDEEEETEEQEAGVFGFINSFGEKFVLITAIVSTTLAILFMGVLFAYLTLF